MESSRASWLVRDVVYYEIGLTDCVSDEPVILLTAFLNDIPQCEGIKLLHPVSGLDWKEMYGTDQYHTSVFSGVLPKLIQTESLRL